MTGREKVIIAAKANGWTVRDTTRNQSLSISKGSKSIYVGISMSGVVLEASGNWDGKGRHLLGKKKADQLVAILGSSN